MRRMFCVALLAGLLIVSASPAYVEAPMSLGDIVNQSTNIVLVEVTKINKEKNLIYYKKVKDLKGKHATEEVKHNIGKGGFHPREWQNVMNWAEPGKKAVFFHNGGASETCIGTYWYQAYPNGEWWGLSHAEPFLLRSYCGDVDKLVAAVTDIVAGKEVIVTCFADGNKEQLHQRKGKMQRVKASLKRLNYDNKRDFVAWGGDGDEIDEFKTVVLLGESTPGWKFIPASQAKDLGNRWTAPGFDDKAWRTGKAPIGYGEEELGKRQGTVISEKGQPFYFRRVFEMPSELLNQKGVMFRVAVASDDSATVYLNGQLLDQDPEEDHEFAYWNRDLEFPAKAFRAGTNVLAVLVKNKPASSDLYLDMEISAAVPVPKPAKKPAPK